MSVQVGMVFTVFPAKQTMSLTGAGGYEIRIFLLHRDGKRMDKFQTFVQRLVVIGSARRAVHFPFFSSLRWSLVPGWVGRSLMFNNWAPFMFLPDSAIFTFDTMSTFGGQDFHKTVCSPFSLPLSSFQDGAVQLSGSDGNI